MKKKINIHEVGLRDGLQAEGQTVPREKKLEWIEGLLFSGVDTLQIGSFVHPEKVPQMADTDALFEALRARPAGGRARFSGLVLNEKGVGRGLACGVELFCMGVSASETHSRKNTGMGTAEATRRIIAMASAVKRAGCEVQVSVQSAFGCGFEGEVPAERVLGIVRAYLDAGFFKISLADTAGHAHPVQVKELFGALLSFSPRIEAACHFHDTYGLGMANVFAALSAGVTSIESSFAGLGGCPFTKVAAGNIATEDAVHALQRMGLRPDISLACLIETARSVSSFFDRELPGRVYKTGPIAYALPLLAEAVT